MKIYLVIKTGYGYEGEVFAAYTDKDIADGIAREGPHRSVEETELHGDIEILGSAQYNGLKLNLDSLK